MENSMKKLTVYEQAVEDAMEIFPNARRNAVNNAPMGKSFTDGLANALNLEADRKAYGWNVHTMNAIRYVMETIGKPC
jgi:hypothetical protein